jgi:excisionase family DNA binding protein
MENAVQQLLTIDELADRLRVKRSWLYSRTREKGEGAIPKIRVGKYVRFDEAAVIEWLKGKQDAD